MNASLAWGICAFIGFVLVVLFWRPLTAWLTTSGVDATLAFGLAFLVLFLGPPLAWLAVRDRF